ncbi:HIT-like protein, partial [Mollisia scopiformis]
MFCPFCAISTAIPPSTSPALFSSPKGSAYPVLATPTVIAFLDIAPISPGHILLCPRRHVEKASSMTGAEAAALGFWLPVLGRAVIGALGQETESASWNVIQANGSEAGQTIPHSHFHVIPRSAPGNGKARDASEIGDAERKNIALGEGPRVKLEDGEGRKLMELIKEKVKGEVE